MLWSLSEEWHILPQQMHYGVFGFNMFQDGHFLSKITILGGGDQEEPHCTHTRPLIIHLTKAKFPHTTAILGPNFLTLRLFLIAQTLDEWAQKHSSPNVAEYGWECFAAVSEYDYLFVCTLHGSEHYGSTRIVTNNLFEDKNYTPPPFLNFVDRLEAFISKWVNVRETYPDKALDDDLELPEFRSFDAYELANAT